MKKTNRKKILVAGVAAGAIMGISGAVFAFFTTTGSGSGSGSVGTSTALTIDQASITYSNAATDDVLLPGTSADVTFTVDNPSSGHQQLGTISLSSVTSDKAGCNSTAQPTWFTAAPVVVNTDYAPGLDQAVTGTMTINFNNVAASQDVCKGATLTFNYAA